MGESFPMNGGEGAHSYSKNSQFQKQASDSVNGLIQEAVMQNLDTEKVLSISTTITIADLGCSVGPNTFFAVQNLIESVESKLSPSSKSLEFQVLFNDHGANDFNTLFTTLPPGRQYYAAGVPGSFHGRLFPANSITIAYSSYALHWLSRQPRGPVNEGRIHCIGAPEDVVKAYSDQFSRDLEVFMSARAEETVSGGLMFLIMPGIPPQSDFPGGFFFNFLGSSLMEMANEGVVERAKIDEFNLPLYAPTAAEVREVIEKNGCFSIERMELRNPRLNVEGPIDAASLIANMRAGTEGVFASHFGSSVVERCSTKFLQKLKKFPSFCSLLPAAIVALISSLLFSSANNQDVSFLQLFLVLSIQM